MLAIIGGSGLTRLSTLAISRREIVRTPYGEPSAPLLFGSVAGCPTVFLARHGHGHTIPPHRVNYRANLWALKARDVKAVLAVASVGGIRHAPPGALVLPDQVIDYHVAPRRQFVVNLTGSVSLESSTGEKRVIGPGEILLAEDTTGKGHISRDLSGPRHSLFLPLAADVDLTSWRA